MAVKQRKLLWKVFGGVLEGLEQRGLLDWPGLCRRAEELLATGRASSPFTAVVIDEVQDLKPPALRFLKALCQETPGNLMLCGDAGQRIYPGGFSLGALGIDVRGRATILRINYRTTEQIRRSADRMLGDASDDMDGGKERRTGTRSLLRGPDPRLVGHGSHDEELHAAESLIRDWMRDGLAAEAIGVFARTHKQIDALGDALGRAGIGCRRLSDKDASGSGEVRLGTMHRAKGLEFKAVLVFGLSDHEVPNPMATRASDDPQDRESAEARERQLLYVAMTRARDELTLSWTGKPSRFLLQLIEDGEADA